MPKFKAAFHANLQGFMLDVKLNRNAHSYGFFHNVRAHSLTVAFSAKLHGLYVNANLARSNLVGQTKSRISKLRRLGYSLRFRMRHTGLVKCRGLHVSCKSALRKWPTSAKHHWSGSAGKAAQDQASQSRRSQRPAASQSRAVCSPDKVAQKVEEFLHSPQMLVQVIVQLLRLLHRKLPLTWLRDVAKLYLYEGQVTGTGLAAGVPSYLVASTRQGLLQPLCLLATLLLLLNLAMAAIVPRLALCISTLFLDYLGLLAQRHRLTAPTL